jgi:hypothetical protein
VASVTVVNRIAVVGYVVGCYDYGYRRFEVVSVVVVAAAAVVGDGEMVLLARSWSRLEWDGRRWEWCLKSVCLDIRSWSRYEVGPSCPPSSASPLSHHLLPSVSVQRMGMMVILDVVGAEIVVVVVVDVVVGMGKD